MIHTKIHDKIQALRMKIHHDECSAEAQSDSGACGMLQGWGVAAQWALRDILMSRGKNCLPIVSRQFLTRNYPRPNRLLKCLPNCPSPTGEGIFPSCKITPAVRVIARQLRDKNCPGAIFAPGHQDVSQGPLGGWS